MFEIWCEWDIGTDGMIFPTLEVAKKHARFNYEVCGCDEMEPFEEAEECGLIQYREV